jgi:hypothetical protein
MVNPHGLPSTGLRSGPGFAIISLADAWKRASDFAFDGDYDLKSNAVSSKNGENPCP